MISEHCAECDSLTGKAGRYDGSLYHAHEGPFCEECYYAWDELVIEERDRLRALLATPDSIPDAGEEVDFWWTDEPLAGRALVMKVADHNRIVSALRASAMVVPDVDALKAEIVSLSVRLENSDAVISSIQKIITRLNAASPAPGDDQ